MPASDAAAFISYSRTDSAFALKLAEDLKAAGAHVWLDQLDIHPGVEWDNAIETALSNAPSVILILSPSSAKSSNVRNEISFALDEKKVILPILHQDCAVPLQLRRIQHVDFRADYAAALHTLLGQLSVDAPTPTPALTPAPVIVAPKPAPPPNKPIPPPRPTIHPPIVEPAQQQPSSAFALKAGIAFAAFVVVALAAYFLWPRPTPPVIRQPQPIKGVPYPFKQAPAESPITYTIWVATSDGSFLGTANDTDFTISKPSNAPYINEVRFLTPNLGWAVGGTNIVRTTDGGVFWDVQTNPTSSSLYSIAFASPKAGWAVGQSGTILHSGNGGATWTQQASGTTVRLGEVTFATDRAGWAVGDNGTILHTDDAGSTWSPQPSGVTVNLDTVVFATPDIGWAGGKLGAILHTTDGGRSWQRQPLGDNVAINCIFFVSPQTGWFVGDKGVIRRTDDGGATWTPQPSPTANSLSSIAFRNPSEGWAAGANGALIHTTDGGATWTRLKTGTTLNLESVALLPTAKRASSKL